VKVFAFLGWVDSRCIEVIILKEGSPKFSD